MFPSDAFLFSMDFIGELESTPATTRATVQVEITIIILDMDAMRFLFRALRAFSDWKFME